MAQPTRPLRVIVVDDNPDDRALVVRELERAFPGLETVEAPDATALNGAILGGYDLLITDYQLLWSTGLDVLRMSKSRRPDVPVIMFTATGTQEVAVEAMKSGLDDYVVKSAKHYVRLPTAAKAAMDRAEMRRRAADLELRLQTLLNILNVGVFRTSPYGELLECNPAFLRILGVGSIEEARGSDLWGRIRWREGRPGALDLLEERGRRTSHEVRLMRADGTTAWVAVSQVLTGPEGRPVIDGLAEDISGRKRASEEIRRLTESLEQTVATRTAELREANTELGELAAAVAGDLHEPMQTVRAALREPSGSQAQLPAALRARLEALVSAAERLEARARGLLSERGKGAAPTSGTSPRADP